MNSAMIDIRPSQTAACLVIGSIALLILGIQPVLLAPLVVEQRLGESDVGYLVTAEMIAIALGTLLGLTMLRTMSARVVAGLAGILLVSVNAVLVGRAGLSPLLAARSMAGLAEGVLVSLPIVVISRSLKPELLAAIFLAGQTFLQLVVASFLPILRWADSRADAALAALAVAGAAGTLFAAGVPSRLQPAESNAASGAISRASGIALLSAGLYMGAIVVVWIFFGVWLERHGHPPALEAVVAPICLGAQIAGALLAAKVSDRLPDAPTIAICAVGEMFLVALLLGSSASGPWIAVAVGAFGFLWLFALPSFTGLLIAIDPQRRSVLYGAAAQLLGSAVIPSVGAGFVKPGDVDGAFYLGMGCFAAAAIAALASAALLRRT